MNTYKIAVYEGLYYDFPRNIYLEDDYIFLYFFGSDHTLKDICCIHVDYFEFMHLVDMIPSKCDISVKFPTSSDLLDNKCFVDLEYYFNGQFLGYRRLFYQGDILSLKEKNKIIKSMRW